jgi:hypothetical protein
MNEDYANANASACGIFTNENRHSCRLLVFAGCHKVCYENGFLNLLIVVLK